MEKKAIAVVGVLAFVATLIIISGVAYATVGQFSGQGTHNNMTGHHGYGGSMMGRATGYYSGIMGDNNVTNWSCPCMHCLGSNSSP